MTFNWSLGILCVDTSALTRITTILQDDEIPLLSDLFSVGQLVACTVCKLELSKGKKEDGKPEKKGRRIELSLSLSLLHEGLTVDSLHDGQVRLFSRTNILLQQELCCCDWHNFTGSPSSRSFVRLIISVIDTRWVLGSV